MSKAGEVRSHCDLEQTSELVGRRCAIVEKTGHLWLGHDPFLGAMSLVVGTGIDPVTSRVAGAIGRFLGVPDRVR
jgi:hypothetical protein